MALLRSDQTFRPCSDRRTRREACQSVEIVKKSKLIQYDSFGTDQALKGLNQNQMQFYNGVPPAPYRHSFEAFIGIVDVGVSIELRVVHAKER